MNPVLYPSTETVFKSNGIGVLGDTISCLVTEERNGSYELEMKYPSNGMWSEEMEVGQILKARANDTDDPQLFVIYDIVRNLSGSYTVKGQHISYRLNGYPVKAYSATGAAAAIAGVNGHAVQSTGFIIDTDLTSGAAYKLKTPRSARAVLGGTEGSILDIFGGEYHFDNFNVHLLKHRGSDNGVAIRYGKNLTDIEQDINGSVYNGVYGYWSREKEGLVSMTSAVMSPTATGIPCIEVVDMTQDFDKKPTAAQLQTLAQQRVSGMGSPVESIDVSFVSLHQLQEYKTIAALEHVSLCDIVTVQYPILGIDVKTKVVKTVYNSLTEHYETITIGSIQTTLADLINDGMSDTKTSTDDIVSAMKGAVISQSYDLGSQTVGANASKTVNPGTNIAKSGYYALGTTNTRTGSGSVVVTRMTVNSDHTQIGEYIIHNMTGSQVTTSIKCTVLYVREDLMT